MPFPLRPAFYRRSQAGERRFLDRLGWAGGGSMTVEDKVRLTPDELRERIARVPRIRGFLLGPTPLEEAPRLSEALGGPRILIKRDDLTGFAFGGNKVRALEFRMADVKAKGCD